MTAVRIRLRCRVYIYREVGKTAAAGHERAATLVNMASCLVGRLHSCCPAPGTPAASVAASGCAAAAGAAGVSRQLLAGGGVACQLQLLLAV